MSNPKSRFNPKISKNPAPPPFHKASARTIVQYSKKPKIDGSTVDQKINDVKRNLERAGINLFGVKILRFDKFTNLTGEVSNTPIVIIAEDSEISDILFHGDERLDLLLEAINSSGFWFEPIGVWAMELYPLKDRDEKIWQEFLEEYYSRKNNPQNSKRSPAKISASALIDRCQNLWSRYFNKPTKENLKAVFAHLDKMKSSKSEKVKKERARCLRAANKEAKRLKMAG